MLYTDIELQVLSTVFIFQITSLHDCTHMVTHILLRTYGRARDCKSTDRTIDPATEA